jgi:hypothetical protein
MNFSGPPKNSPQSLPFEPIDIMQLRPGRCACLVPVLPYPRYCGLPTGDNGKRMCEWHAQAYIVKGTKR